VQVEVDGGGDCFLPSAPLGFGFILTKDHERSVLQYMVKINTYLDKVELINLDRRKYYFLFELAS
jgi:hypothetical protein